MYQKGVGCKPSSKICNLIKRKGVGELPSPTPLLYCYTESKMHQIANASTAYMLALVQGQLTGSTAENTGSLVLLQNDLIILSEDLQLIPLSNVQYPTQFNG